MTVMRPLYILFQKSNIELLNAVDNTMDTVECSAVNNLIQPPNNKRKAMKKIDLRKIAE